MFPFCFRLASSTLQDSQDFPGRMLWRKLSIVFLRGGDAEVGNGLAGLGESNLGISAEVANDDGSVDAHQVSPSPLE